MAYWVPIGILLDDWDTLGADSVLDLVREIVDALVRYCIASEGHWGQSRHSSVVLVVLTFDVSILRESIEYVEGSMAPWAMWRYCPLFVALPQSNLVVVQRVLIQRRL